MTLTEKYRPRDWPEIVGQEKAIAKLRLLEQRGFGGRAVWISGVSGCGKTTCARIIASKVAEDFCIEELDAGELTAGRLDALIKAGHYIGWPPKSGRAIIVNEAHGLRADMIRRLLVALEDLPPHTTWIFTTTADGQKGLFGDHEDAGPLLSRCSYIALTNQGLRKPFAAHARAIALKEGLDGRPEAWYYGLADRCRSNLRAMLQAIEAGEALAGSDAP